jgi:hypothetical protein
MDYSFDSSPQEPLRKVSDLARHFVDCAALNANISLAPGSRLVITDDLLDGTVGDLAAVSMAAIASRDPQVGYAAIIPLGMAAQRAGHRDGEKYERIFRLIEESAFDNTVREAANELIVSRFRESQIRDLIRELGGAIGPARQRYRAFLDIIKLLTANKITHIDFVQEFSAFTQAVAGKLDFGIYSLCVDRLFVSEHIPLIVKALLCKEVVTFPPLVRKELLTNLLASDKAPGELVAFARGELAGVMTRDQLREIFLFTTLKLAWKAQAAIVKR